MSEVWRKNLADDFASLPDHSVSFSEGLKSELLRINEHMSMAVRSGTSIESIKSIDGYHRFENALRVVKTHNQTRGIQETEAFEQAQTDYEETEARIVETAKRLIIPDEITKFVREHLNVIDNESDDFSRYNKALTELREKGEEDLRYRIASQELRGQLESALELKMQYIKSLQEASSS